MEEKSQKLPNIGILSCLYYLWKINGPAHVKVITAPYTDPDQPAQPDQNHHIATQSAPRHTEKTMTWLRRCAGWAESSKSAHLPRIPVSGSIDFKVTSLEIIYVTKSTYECVKRAQYSHLGWNIKLQWNNVREFCLKNNLQLILIFNYASICKLAHPYAFNILNEMGGLQNLKLRQTGHYVIMLNKHTMLFSVKSLVLELNYIKLLSNCSNCDLSTHRLRYKETSLLWMDHSDDGRVD